MSGETTDSDELRQFFETPPPRADAAVDTATGDAVERARQYARKIGLGYAVILTVLSLVTGLILTLAGLPDVEPGLAVGVVAVWAITGIILPAWGMYWVIGRDAKAIRRLARLGTIYKPTGIRGATDSALEQVVALRWRENGREAKAIFELRTRDIEPVPTDQIFVVSRKHDSFVLASLGGNGIFVGKRRR